jgi:hypothetical protein
MQEKCELLDLTEKVCQCMEDSELMLMRLTLKSNARFNQLTAGTSAPVKLLRHIMTTDSDLRAMKSILRYQVGYGDRERGKNLLSVIDWSDPKVSTALVQAIAESDNPAETCPYVACFEKLREVVSQSKSCVTNDAHLRIAIQYAVKHLLVYVQQRDDDESDEDESDTASPVASYHAPLLECLRTDPQWALARRNLQVMNARRASLRPPSSVSHILASAVAMYIQVSFDVTFDEMRTERWTDEEQVVAGLSTKLDFVLRPSVIHKLASCDVSMYSPEAVQQFQDRVRPALQLEIMHRFKTLHRGFRAFHSENDADYSPRPYLQAIEHSSLSAFSMTSRKIQLPSMYAYGSLSGDDGAVVVAGLRPSMNLVYRSEIGGGKDMAEPTPRQCSNGILLSGRERRMIVQDVLAFLGGPSAIAALPYLENEQHGADPAYSLAWQDLLAEKGGTPALNKYLGECEHLGALRTAKLMKLVDVLFSKTVPEDKRELRFLEHIIYACRINVDTVATTSKVTQASLALRMRALLQDHGGSRGVFAAMNLASVTRKLAFVTALLEICTEPAYAVLGSSFAKICERMIESVTTHGHAFLLMASFEQVCSSDRETLRKAQDAMKIPKQEVCNVCCADGLGGGMSTVFEVLGGLPDGTARAELAQCADKLKACGVSEKNAIFVRMLQWIVREIETPEAFKKLPAGDQLVFLPYVKVDSAERARRNNGTAPMVKEFFRDLSSRTLSTGINDIWRDVHFADVIRPNTAFAFGNWNSWSYSDRGPSDLTCNAVTTCVLAQVITDIAFGMCRARLMHAS